MKKILIALMFLSCQSYAQTVAPTNVDKWYQKVWTFAVDDGDALHFLDNATAASLYDFNRKEWLGGGMTSLYQPLIKGVKPLSLDFGVSSTMQQGDVGFPFGAVRFHGRELLNKNASVKSFFDARQNLLKYLTCGGWTARDFNYGIWRYGGFLGAEAKF
jgi:hypothetical protein